MDTSDPARAARPSIACDPTNYDWNELDQHASSNQKADIDTAIANAICAAPGLGDIANGSATTGPSKTFPHADFPRRKKATDKDIVDFMYGESATETMMRLSNEFVPIVQPGADTLIYIGTPPQLAGQSDHEYSYVRRQFQRPYLLRSDTLRQLGSAKFQDLLGPRSARTQRRLQKAGIHKLLLEPQNIKYFIDLTPNIHDDEGMILLTELSAPQGARAWHQNARRYNIDSSHVCGRDALDVPPRPIYRPQSQDDAARDLEHGDQAAKSNDAKKPLKEASDPPNEQQPNSEKEVSNASDYELPLEDDYCQLRHYTAIARLLHAIAGQDPKLNSAPKVWTFCMLAKFFDCSKSNLINRWVIDWLVQSNNLNFIQANPSVAYRLGLAIEAIWLVRTSFTILVGQKAFSNTAADLRHLSAFPFEPANLITEDLDDDEINRVDHAVSALVRRVKDSLSELLRVDGKWLTLRKPRTELDDFYKAKLTDPEGQSLLQVAKTSLERYVQRLLCGALVEVDYSKKTSGDLLRSSSNVTARYNDVPSLVRPWTLQFWELLQKEDFSVDHTDQPHLRNHKYWARTLEALISDGVIAPELIDIPYVSRTELTEALDLLNTMAFYPRPELKESSPTKKVKLSPPVATNDIPTYPQSPVLKKPAVQSAGASTQNIWETQRRRKYSWESDSDWDKEMGLKDEILHNSEDDDWVDLQGKLESNTPTQTVPAQDLPIRNKPAVSQVQPVQASIQGNEVKAEGQFEKFSSLEQDYQGLLHSISSSVQREKERQKPSITQDQLRDKHGNLISPQPGKPFSVFPVNDNTPQQQLSKSGRKCGTCDKRRVKCDQTYPTCGQCSRQAFVCKYKFELHDDNLRFKRSGSSHLDGSSYVQPSSYLGHKTEYSHYEPTKSPFDTVDGNNFQSGRVIGATTGPLSHRLDTTSLSDDMRKAIQDSNRYRPYDPRVQSSRLRVTNPDIEPNSAITTRSDGCPRRSTSPDNVFHFYFNVTALLINIHECVSRFVEPLITPGFIADRSCAYEIPINDVGVLTCLTQDEYKYLPLWAGGNDDGTGGVFNDDEDIPEALEVEYGGFRGGAMGIIPGVGSSIGGSMAGSEFEEIMTEVGVSTVGRASRIATDGEETVMSLDE